MQLDQKKVPIFHGEPDKDILTVREWARRIESMKSSMNWNEKTTYENGIASLFGAAALWMGSMTDTEVNEDFEETWVWLKKKMLSTYGGMKTTRAYVDIMVNLTPRTNPSDPTLGTYLAHIHQEFKKITDTMDRIAIPDGNHDAAAVRDFCLKAQKRTMAQVTMAFMINLMPSTLRTKLLEAGPNTIGEVFKAFEIIHENHMNANRPVSHLSKPLVHMLDTEEYLEDPELVAAVQRLQTKWGQGGSRPANQGNNKNNQKKKSGNQNKSEGNKSDKKCTHCNKNGHGVVECFKRIREGAPCFNSKGEPYYPASDKTSPHAPKVNTSDVTETTLKANTQGEELPTATRQEGGLKTEKNHKEDFPAWV